MDKTVNELKNIFEENLSIRDEILSEDSILAERARQAESNLVTLQEKIDKIRAERPALLADGNDVSNLNKKLKKFEEEIELNSETISGVQEKRKEYKQKIFRAKQDVNHAFKDYINKIKEQTINEYMEIAPKFAEIIKEYITLSEMASGDSWNIPMYISSSDIKRIPDLSDNKGDIFRYNYYKIYFDNKQKIHEKYNIPDYTIEKLRQS